MTCQVLVLPYSGLIFQPIFQEIKGHMTIQRQCYLLTFARCINRCRNQYKQSSQWSWNCEPKTICGVLHMYLMYTLSLLIDLLFQESKAMLLLKLWKQQLHWLAIPRWGPMLALDTAKLCSEQCYPGSVSFFTIFKYHLLVVCQHTCLLCQSAYSRAEAASALCYC